MSQGTRAAIVVIGASGHAKAVIDIIERQGACEVYGLVDTHKNPGTKLMGYEVLGPDEEIPRLLHEGKIVGGIIAIGHNWVRYQMAQRVMRLAPDFVFINAIHPSAQVAREVQLGKGIAIMAGVCVKPDTRIADLCFLNTNASVGHDSVFEESSCLQPNVATGGNVRIGTSSAVSIGATVLQGVTIGSHTVIGAGSTVLSDVPDRVVAYGTPCRVIRTRQADEDYY